MKWKNKDQQPKKRLSFTLCLFYIGLIAMSLTGVTFCRYSTVLKGTISVTLASANSVTFLDDEGNIVSEMVVYDGQRVPRLPEDSAGSDLHIATVSTASNAVSTFSLLYVDREEGIKKRFQGWSLDGEEIVDPTEIEVLENLVFYAVYEITEITSDATPSNAERENLSE